MVPIGKSDLLNQCRILVTRPRAVHAFRRSGSWRERDPQAGNGLRETCRRDQNWKRIVKMTFKMVYRVHIRKEGKAIEIKWLGDLDSNQDSRSQSPMFYR